jgi:menaquinone-specific isochorismate synthase
VSITCRTVKLDSLPDLVELTPESGGFVWLAEGTSLVGLGQAIVLRPGGGPDRFERAAMSLHSIFGSAQVIDEVDLPGSGPVAFGSFAFDQHSSESMLIIPKTIYGRGDGVAWKTEIESTPSDESPQDVETKAALVDVGRSGGTAAVSDSGWIAQLVAAKAAMSREGIEKVVLAKEVRIDAESILRRTEIVRKLAFTFPGCFTFAFGDLVGASPELLVRRLGETVDSIPLAGSARRGGDAAEDEMLGQNLQASKKNRLEHELTVASVLEALGPVCSELVAEPEPSLLLLANVQHLSTKVQGRLARPLDALRLAGLMHPTAAVCGVPQQPALELIRRIEGFDRGPYAGPVGWVDHRGDGEWAIALRCARIRARTAMVWAGAGIVADSDPQEELEEVNLKLEAMLQALS